MTKQEILAKYAKHFAASDKEKAAIFKGIRYAENNEAVVTNRHYLLRIKGVHDFTSPITLDAKTGIKIDGNFPDFLRAFPQNHDFNLTLRPGDEMTAALNSSRYVRLVAEAVDKRHPIARLEMRGGVAELFVKSPGVRMQAFIGNSVSPIDAPAIGFNAAYLHTAMSLFADYGKPMSIEWSSKLSPMLLSAEDIDVIVLPYNSTD